MYAGTKDGKNYGFYLTNDGLKHAVKLTGAEHMALMDGQSTGKVILFYPDKKPTLEEPSEPTARETTAARIAEYQRLLNDTDWYAVRKTETGQEIPADILEQRKNAREAISALREKLNEKESV